MRGRRGPSVALAIGLVAFAVWVTGAAGTAQACTCAQPPTEREVDRAAETIIVGRPAAVIEHDDTTEIEYVVDVEVLHKGEITDPVSLFTPREAGHCGVGLAEGQLYKLYPRRGDDGRLRIELCGGNRPATDADLEPLVLDPPAPPTTAPPTAAPPPTTAAAPSSSTLTTLVPPALSTATSASLLVPSTTGSTGPDDEAALAIDDDGDDDGDGFVAAVGTAVVAAVGGAVVSYWLQRGRRS